MQLFSAGTAMFSKKFKPHENMKNLSQKLLIISPQNFSVLAWLPKQPKNRNPVPPKAP